MPTLSPLDRLLSAADSALRTLAAPAASARRQPQPQREAPPLTAEEKALSGALMRVNHVGEVCAQALYTAQALSTRDPALRAQLEEASREETDHLAWTHDRIRELGTHRSYLNPLWYLGAFSIGLLAGRVGGDKVSLGFVVETERQVEAHLASHLDRLPANDLASRAVVTQMAIDERHHADSAEQAGGMPLPLPARWLMRMAAKVMTTTAHRI
jgi:ubiquinone biosynthesis monooxygenase Coq7